MLSLAAVSAGYSSFRALFDVSLEVAAGEAVGVIGPNGAGKTTMMRVISGLVPLVSGAMTFDGRALNGLSAHRIVERGIAHVPENRRLFPRLTVEDNLRIGAFIPQARQRIAERMAWVYDLFPRLKERREQLAGTLSGGVQQVFDLAHRSRAEGLTVLIVEQNVQQVLDVVDRAYLLEVGRIRLAGSSAELREEPLIRRAYMGL